MRLSTRKMLDRSFSGLGFFSIGLMALALVVLLAPICVGGVKAIVFRGTIEHRRFLLEKMGRGDRVAVEAGIEKAQETRLPVYARIEEFEKEMEGKPRSERRKYRKELGELKEALRELLGPMPGETRPVLPRDQYGQTRWDRASAKLRDLLYVESYDYSNSDAMGVEVFTPRSETFAGTALEPLFPYVETHLAEMLRPRLTFYWGFFTDRPIDANMFGGIWPALLGTIYLTLGAMLIAAPLGVIAAVYFVEYAGDNPLVSALRSCVSTLAGVPSIVFGLFGLAFLINTIHVSEGKSVLAGSLTLALLVLPTVIRSAEEAIRAVPNTYREAAMGLGASKWRTVTTVVLPAALSGILTGTIISTGRAAGETAPIIFTAAVSVGKPLRIWEVFTQGTPALPWSIYNLCTEHEAVDEIRHVQYGMVLTLVLAVLSLNLCAVIVRARISRRQAG
ncbi:phosphate ABC transporter permease PstA [Candidatus Sumerlaeota bacterium]|nr:phosphate ABC transporter permease PstA [Candidatus Sumerlaeota bacterium]